MKRRILLVDDDPAVRRMLLRLLNEENYSVRTARTGCEALELARSETFHLFLLDCELPDENGAEICRQFISAHPDLPIVILRSASDGSLASGANRVGVCLEKPLDMEKLLRTIHELLTPVENSAERITSRPAPATPEITANKAGRPLTPARIK
jgi:DNA-binding response OmpR family regulator